jgi:hypothetical protein
MRKTNHKTHFFQFEIISLGLGLDAIANQNKETKAMLTSMKLIKKITTHYYLLHDYTGFYTYFVN